MAGKIEQAELALTESVAKAEQALTALNDVTEGGEVAGGLPEGWCTSNLGEIIELKYGKSLPAKTRDGKGSPVYGSNGIVGFHSEPLLKSEAIIVGRKGSFGEIQLSKTPCFPIDTTYFVDNFFCQPIKYWYYQLKDLPLTSLNRSTAIPGLNREDAYSQRISLPPLAEQTVIAQTLDTLLAQVDNIKNRLDAIPNILKTFRQSVLAAAVSGKLTEEWRGENVGYSSASLNGGSWGDLPNNWQVKAYKEVVDSRLGKMLDKAKNTGVPTKYLGNINVRWFAVDLEKTQEILVSEKEVSELNLLVGDVLICEGGEPGRCAIWNMEQSEPIIFQKALHRARVSKELIPEWLLYNLKTDADNLFLEQFFTGTTIKHLTGKALAKYPLRIPPIEEQAEIVRRVKEFLAFADQIEQQVKNAQGRVNNLTQSILAKAFRGELTMQWRAENPDLISGDSPENGSAELLLAKIKEERDAIKQKTKPKKASKKKMVH